MKKGRAHDRKSCWVAESFELNQLHENIRLKACYRQETVTPEVGNNHQQIKAISVMTGQTCDR